MSIASRRDADGPLAGMARNGVCDRALKRPPGAALETVPIFDGGPVMLRSALALMLLIFGATSATAGEFMVKNCSQGAVTLSGFNENDEIRLFFSSKEVINRGQTGKVWCWTGSCQMHVSSGMLPDKLFGPFNSSRCLIAGYSQYDVYPLEQNIDDCSVERCR
jgi:hypothetical protein